MAVNMPQLHIGKRHAFSSGVTALAGSNQLVLGRVSKRVAQLALDFTTRR